MAVRAYGKSVKSYTAWAALTEYSLSVFRVPTSDNGRCYECTTVGTSGETEPTWDVTVDSTISDGSVVWTCREKEAQAGALTVTLDATTAGGYAHKDVWVKSDAEATFIVYGSWDGQNWRQIDTIDLPDGEAVSTHKTYSNAYPYIGVGTAAVANNEIEIVAGE